MLYDESLSSIYNNQSAAKHLCRPTEEKYNILKWITIYAGVVESVDMRDLGSRSESCTSSSLVTGTMINNIFKRVVLITLAKHN